MEPAEGATEPAALEEATDCLLEEAPLDDSRRLGEAALGLLLPIASDADSRDGPACD